MQDHEFIPIFKRLAIAYGGRLDDSGEAMDVYYSILRDLPVELVQAAALEFMASPSAFPPTPGQIRDKALRLVRRTNRVPSAAEAWQELLGAPGDGIMRETQENDDPMYPWVIIETAYQFSHPLVEKVARNLGWPSRFWTDNLVSDRSRFMNTYEQELDRATLEETSLPEVREYIERSGGSDIRQIVAGFRRDALERGER
jgi:hypothetical protein